ncbi:MAG TPA: ATP-binding protein [Streptosporangiaceae bacterium]
MTGESHPPDHPARDPDQVSVGLNQTAGLWRAPGCVNLAGWAPCRLAVWWKLTTDRGIDVVSMAGENASTGCADGERVATEVDAVQAVRRGDRLLRWVFLLCRLAPLSQAVLTASGHVPGMWRGLFAVLAAESVVLLPLAMTGLPDWAFVAADFAVVTAVLTGAAVTARHPGELATLWGGLLYVVSVAAVLLHSRVQAVMAAEFWVATQIVITSARFGPAALLSWRQLWQAAAQAAFMLLIYTLAAEYRGINEALDRARRHDVAREAALLAERERGRHYRLLHDRVLQTMDTLARGRWIADAQIHDQVRGEARWLRQLIGGQLDDQPDDLHAALMSVINSQPAGLAVDLHAGRPHPPVLAAVVEALSAAVGEALTNVRKHADVDRAVVSVLPARAGVLVTIVDDGCGFDPAQETSGLGIRQCLQARMREVAGAVRLDAAPGRGTHVELWAPVAVSKPRDDRDRAR